MSHGYGQGDLYLCYGEGDLLTDLGLLILCARALCLSVAQQ